MSQYTFVYCAVFRMGSYLLVLYLVSKLCYIANVLTQLFVLNKVLGMTYSTFGIDMIKCVLSKIASIVRSPDSLAMNSPMNAF